MSDWIRLGDGPGNDEGTYGKPVGKHAIIAIVHELEKWIRSYSGDEGSNEYFYKTRSMVIVPISVFKQMQEED